MQEFERHRKRTGERGTGHSESYNKRKVQMYYYFVTHTAEVKKQ
jgi:hypothetical protein